MIWGRLEREIRLLPQVLSCSVNDDEVVVLVMPTADRAVAEADVVRILGDDRRGIRILGGASAILVPRTRRAVRSPLVLLGSVAASAALAVGSLLVGLGVRDGGSSRRPPAVAAGPALIERPPGAATGGDGEPVVVLPIDDISPAVSQVDPLAAEPPVSAEDLLGRTPRTALPAGDEAASPPATLGSSDQPEVVSCNESEARGAPRDVRGRHRGQGPASWSHSVLVDPHCERGRPR